MKSKEGKQNIKCLYIRRCVLKLSTRVILAIRTLSAKLILSLKNLAGGQKPSAKCLNSFN